MSIGFPIWVLPIYSQSTRVSHGVVKLSSFTFPCFLGIWVSWKLKTCSFYSQVRDCFICKKGGHRAKNCPEKHMNVFSSSNICLKCGDPGHDMFSCQNLYPDDDLKVVFYLIICIVVYIIGYFLEMILHSLLFFSTRICKIFFFQNIQCYICKKFGHLCCVNSTSDTSIHISCYKCGQTGHTGLVSPLYWYLTVYDVHMMLMSPLIFIWDALLFCLCFTFICNCPLVLLSRHLAVTISKSDSSAEFCLFMHIEKF